MNRRRIIASTLALTAAAVLAPFHRPAPVEHVHTGGAWLCDGTLIVGYGLERLTGHEWTFVQDDGRVTVQTSPRTGRWVTVPTTSGGEGLRRAPGSTIPPLQLVRVVRGGVASSARPVSEGCPA